MNNDNHEYKKEIKNLKLQVKELEKLAYIDNLTGLFRRIVFKNDLDIYIEKHLRGNFYFSMLFIDVDGLKEINDSKGHKAGDKLLKQVAKVLQKSVRRYDKVYRYAGDEFIILVHTDMLKVLKKICSRISKRSKSLGFSLSIGGSIYSHEESAVQFIERVDKLMYKSKSLDSSNATIG